MPAPLHPDTKIDPAKIKARNDRAKERGFKNWDHWCIELEYTKQRVICGVSTKAGTPCLGNPMENGRCRKHGGKTPVGMASANWVHGKDSRLFPTLPQRLQEKAEQAHADPELLSLRRQIAVLEARDAELYSQLSTGESGAAWATAGRILNEALLVQGDEHRGHEFPGLLAQLESVLGEGLRDVALWREIHENYEQARRLRDSEMVRLKAMQATMDARKVRDIIARLLGIFRKRVTDPETLKLIMADVAKDFGKKKQGGPEKNGQRALGPGGVP